MPEYIYRTKDLLKVLVDIGFSSNVVSARQKVFRLKNEGKFVPPVSSNGRLWVFTQNQLLDIAKNLGPGGSGEWKFGN